MMESNFSPINELDSRGLVATHHFNELLVRITDKKDGKEVGQIPWHDFRGDLTTGELRKWLKIYDSRHTTE